MSVTAALPVDSLNDEQRAAVLADGHLLVIAGAGSGKTKTLAAKAARTLSDPQRSLLAVTFTKESAIELRARITAIVGDSPSVRARLFVGTLHSLCFTLLSGKIGVFGRAIFGKVGSDSGLANKIVKEGEQRLLISQALQAASSAMQHDEAGRAIELFKIGGRDRDNLPDDGRRVAQAYCDALEKAGRIDMQDLVLHAITAMQSGAIRTPAFTDMFVDEVQDNDAQQYQLMRIFSALGTSLTIVGDDDQSIYGFRRAAGYSGMASFLTEYRARKIVLTVNYRSHAEIVEPALKMMAFATNRMDKICTPFKGAGGRAMAIGIVSATAEGSGAASFAKAALGAAKSVAVLTRTNRLLDSVEGHLRAQQVPYRRVSGKSVFEKAEIVAGLAIAHAIVDPSARIDLPLMYAGTTAHDVEKLRHASAGRWLSLTAQVLRDAGVSETGIANYRSVSARLNAWRESLDNGRWTLLSAALCDWVRANKAGTDKVEEGLVALLASIIRPYPSDKKLGYRDLFLQHLAWLRNKERKTEAKESSIAECCLSTLHGSKGLEWDWVWIAGFSHGQMPSEGASPEEERRLTYVGMTRARSRLVISFCTDRGAPSQYIKESGLAFIEDFQATII